MGDWEACKDHLMKNGRVFVQRAKDSRDKIAQNGLPFIRDDDVILVHANSRAVNSLLLLAASKLIRFRVLLQNQESQIMVWPQLRFFANIISQYA